jgi:hypothetical protein
MPPLSTVELPDTVQSIIAAADSLSLKIPPPPTLPELPDTVQSVSVRVPPLSIPHREPKDCFRDWLPQERARRHNTELDLLQEASPITIVTVGVALYRAFLVPPRQSQFW